MKVYKCTKCETVSYECDSCGKLTPRLTKAEARENLRLALAKGDESLNAAPDSAIFLVEKMIEAWGIELPNVQKAIPALKRVLAAMKANP